MPIYEYRCQECQQIFEQWQKDFHDQDKSCPVCGGRSQRLISNTSFVLKGSGWYVTDYSKPAEGSPGGNGTKTDSAETKNEPAAKESPSSSPEPSAPASSTPTAE
jgi:putative FmdB family regulatory protein